MWNKDDWKEKLLEYLTSDETNTILRVKSDFFWESLSQHYCERVFGARLSESVYTHGPMELLTDASSGIIDAHRVVLETSVDGDDLTPPSRIITYTGYRDDIDHPDIHLSVLLPPAVISCSHPVSSDNSPIINRELQARTSVSTVQYDMRPVINGQIDSYKRFVVNARLNRYAHSRSRNIDYPDFNQVFIPLRHLVFEGNIVRVRGRGESVTKATIIGNEGNTVLASGGGHVYDTIQDCLNAFDSLVTMLRENPSAAAQRLEPYLSPDYYHVFDEYTIAPHSSAESNSSSDMNSTDANVGDEGDDSTSIASSPHFHHRVFKLKEFKKYLLDVVGCKDRSEYYAPFNQDFGVVELVVDDSYRISNCPK